jgi:hypothetical protein
MSTDTTAGSDDGTKWYIPANRFDAVYAVGDTHGDVGVAIAVFENLLGVVERTPPKAAGSPAGWRWRRPRCAVVVLGDVVDRSRRHRTSESGENEYQVDRPDDLFLLELLNHWADLADAAGSLLIRLVGNHEVFQRDLRFSTARDERLLLQLERHAECGGGGTPIDPGCNRTASFCRTNGAYFDAIWRKGHPRVIQQIGPWLFVHGGLTERALTYVAEAKPENLFRVARRAAAAGCAGVPNGLADLLQDRGLDAGRNPTTGGRARRLLRRWERVTGGPPVAALVVGHCLQLPQDVAEKHRWNPSIVVHTKRVSDPTTSPAVYRDLGPPTGRDDRPWINASLDAEGRPSIFRCDVGLSRCWSSVVSGHKVCLQALALYAVPGGLVTETLFEPDAAEPLQILEGGKKESTSARGSNRNDVLGPDRKRVRKL